MVRWACIWIMLALFSCNALAAPRSNHWAEELDAAYKALAAQQYPQAYDLFLASAARNPLAQFSLGLFYREGWGRAVDAVTACTWFEKSAQQHIPTAEHFFGDCLAEGIGQNADIPAAIAWYEKATAHGHLISQCSIADFYIQGKGVPKDVNRGIALCAQIAQSNSPPAMLKLANYYQQGQYLPQDLAAARYWYQQAAEKQVMEAQYQLGMMMMQGLGGDVNLDTAIFLLENAASEGYAPAYLPTAVLYANAPVQKETGVLAPEHLAKIYLWTAAAKALVQRPGYQDQQALIERLEAEMQKVMPASWRPELDKQVSEHLAKYPADNAPKPPATMLSVETAHPTGSTP